MNIINETASMNLEAIKSIASKEDWFISVKFCNGCRLTFDTIESEISFEDRGYCEMSLFFEDGIWHLYRCHKGSVEISYLSAEMIMMLFKYCPEMFKYTNIVDIDSSADVFSNKLFPFFGFIESVRGKAAADKTYRMWLKHIAFFFLKSVNRSH